MIHIVIRILKRTGFIKMMLISGHPVHEILNLTSKSDLVTSNYYMYWLSSIYISNVSILTNRKITVFSIFDAIFGTPCTWNQKCGLKIGFCTLVLLYIRFFNDLAKNYSLRDQVAGFLYSIVFYFYFNKTLNSDVLSPFNPPLR